MQPSHYQTLADRGWRRSGTFYYKPDNRNICCPQYTIRLDGTNFQSRKDQRKAVNHWNQHVLGPDYIQKAARFSPKSKQEKKRQKNRFDVCQKIHEPDYNMIPRPVDNRTNEAVQPAHRFEVTLEPDTFTLEKFELFKHYQSKVHHEEPEYTSQSSFKRFLCSGFKQQKQQSEGREKQIGSYHQCYRLDGRLIAVGVLDLLPHCVSSVYLMYYEDYNSWNFGKLSALREIALAVEGGYRYYYMGYYVHSCVKMRYKGDFRPTYLLDPISHEWDLLDPDLLSRLSARNFVSMSLERSLKLPHTSQELEQLLQSPTESSHLDQEIEVGNVRYQTAVDYAKGRPFQSSGSKRASSVFEASTPGVLSLAEVESTVDLHQWKIRVRDLTVTLENLVSWHETSIRDSKSIKGITAELAASIGKDLVERTVLSFH